MNDSVKYKSNKASKSQVEEHFYVCDNSFRQSLSQRVNIEEYAEKIVKRAMRFEAWSNNKLIGLVAAYFDDNGQKYGFITSVSVLSAWTGRGIASQLMKQCISHAKATNIQQLSLEVAINNSPAIHIYEKNGFTVSKVGEQFNTMNLCLMEKKVNSRDYNIEINDTDNHRYAYNFDIDVMHPYMIESFTPFFKTGRLLELGSYKGDFTKRFLPLFDDITCVEVSDVAIMEAENKLGDKVKYFNALFEDVTLPKRYDNIILTHVLEHIDDPVLVLKRINDEWLTEDGRFFLVCPNANAPSRQIATKMGLISHNTAVTPAEAEHGHRRTYTMDTLERDAVAAGLKVVHRSGIFFKALANFQWDLLMETDIISREYLDGCYQLGQQYPDLCSSIFLLCEKGNKK